MTPKLASQSTLGLAGVLATLTGVLLWLWLGAPGEGAAPGVGGSERARQGGTDQPERLDLQSSEGRELRDSAVAGRSAREVPGTIAANTARGIFVEVRDLGPGLALTRPEVSFALPSGKALRVSLGERAPWPSESLVPAPEDEPRGWSLGEVRWEPAERSWIVPLAPAQSLRLTTLDAATGEPVVGPTWSFDWFDHAHTEPRKLDVELRGREPLVLHGFGFERGLLHGWLSGPGYLVSHFDHLAIEPGENELTHRAHSLELASAELRIRVTRGPEGSPVSDAEVEVVRAADERTSHLHWDRGLRPAEQPAPGDLDWRYAHGQRPDANGSLVARVPAPERYRIAVGSAAEAEFLGEPFQVRPGESQLHEIELPAPAVLRGRIVVPAEESERLVLGRLSLLDFEGEHFDYARELTGQGSFVPSSALDRSLDYDYRMEGLAPGRYTLRLIGRTDFMRGPSLGLNLMVTVVELAPGEDRVLDLVVGGQDIAASELASFVVSGEWRRPGPPELQPSWVQLNELLPGPGGLRMSPERQHSIGARLDEAGRFEIGKVEPGRYLLVGLGPRAMESSRDPGRIVTLLGFAEFEVVDKDVEVTVASGPRVLRLVSKLDGEGAVEPTRLRLLAPEGPEWLSALWATANYEVPKGGTWTFHGLPDVPMHLMQAGRILELARDFDLTVEVD
jgi:hypothetical protein